MSDGTPLIQACGLLSSTWLPKLSSASMQPAAKVVEKNFAEWPKEPKADAESATISAPIVEKDIPYISPSMVRTGGGKVQLCSMVQNTSTSLSP